MRKDPCTKCGSFDFYEKGKFSYCRPCHSEAQKRYIKNKAMGISTEHKRAPGKLLSDMLHKNHAESSVTHCPSGHPYSGDNVRITSQRNGKDINRKCRACERDRKRIAYGLPVEPTGLRLTDLL